MLNSNRVTWLGVASFLENTCVSELYLDGYVSSVDALYVAL